MADYSNLIVAYLDTDEKHIRKKLGITPSNDGATILSLKYVSAAAAIFLLAAISIWLFQKPKENNFLSTRQTALQQLSATAPLNTNTAPEGELQQWGRWRLIKQGPS